MQFINKRHLDIPTKKKPELGPLRAITDIAARESHGRHREH